MMLFLNIYTFSNKDYASEVLEQDYEDEKYLQGPPTIITLHICL